MNSLVTFSNGLLHMDVPMMTDQQKLTLFCADTGWSLEDLPSEMTDINGWWNRQREYVLSAGLEDYHLKNTGIFYFYIDKFVGVFFFLFLGYCI